MYLTQQTDYALRMLMYAGSHTDRPLVNIADMARDYQISKSHLMKVATALVKGGFLHSVRGKGGGLALARAPDQIGLGDVVRHMEPMALAECFTPDGRCCIVQHCRLPAVLSGASQAFLAHLDRFRLSDLLHPDLSQYGWQPVTGPVPSPPPAA